MPRIAIAISAFRSDANIIALLEQIFKDPPHQEGPIIVVDSLGSGKIEAEIAAREWPVYYENSAHNLGSAGNLARRMQIAHKMGAEWAMCLNHDANWSSERLEAMVRTAESSPRVGAVYPVLDHAPRKRPWEDGRRSFVPSAGERFEDPPQGTKFQDVLWSSSNGALYATAPRAEGIVIMDSLWMGYEDLAYGIALHAGGWLQLMCRDAILSDIFDYGERRVLGKKMHIPEKPVWYAYYDLRNLLLIRRAFGAQGIRRRSIARKVVVAGTRIAILEKQKLVRLKLALRGLFDGFTGKQGKGRLP